MKKIFVVDDEERIRNLISMYLKKEGYEVFIFSNASDALENFSEIKPDLLVLDIMMKGMDGLDLCRNIRKTSNVPIIFVSARSEELDRILGLELGADDYLPKPFSPRELVVRIKKLLQREDYYKKRFPIKEKKEEEFIEFKNIKLYSKIRLAKYDNEEIHFTNKEFDILYYLIENKGMPLSREEITKKIWGDKEESYDRSVDDTIKRIRKKFRENDININIKTVWGYGYKVDNDD